MNLIESIDKYKINMLKEEKIKINNKIIDIIEKINMGKIEIYNSEKESIISLIEYYSTDDYKNIFEEFSDYIRNKEKYDETLYQYVKDTYKEKIVKVKELYFVGIYDFLEEKNIKELLNIIGKNKIDDIIEFCQNYL